MKRDENVESIRVGLVLNFGMRNIVFYHTDDFKILKNYLITDTPCSDTLPFLGLMRLNHINFDNLPQVKLTTADYSLNYLEVIIL